MKVGDFKVDVGGWKVKVVEFKVDISGWKVKVGSSR